MRLVAVGGTIPEYRRREAYSWRSAVIGSTFVARRAGQKEAKRPANSSRAATAMNESGSKVDNLETWLDNTRTDSRLPMSPTRIPAATSFAPDARIIPI